MEINYSPEKIEFEKELNKIDTLALSFCSILNEVKIQYVIISGYVAILFGRNRASEDIDMFIEEMPYPMFENMWNTLTKEFECINVSTSEEAYKEYLKQGIAIRFSPKDQYVPNIEMKFPANDLDKLALKKKIPTRVNGKLTFIAPLEPQIIFKLYLGSEKDLEDARYLYTLFKEKLDKKMLNEMFRKLKIDERYKEYIR